MWSSQDVNVCIASCRWLSNGLSGLLNSSAVTESWRNFVLLETFRKNLKINPKNWKSFSLEISLQQVAATTSHLSTKQLFSHQLATLQASNNSAVDCTINKFPFDCEVWWAVLTQFYAWWRSQMNSQLVSLKSFHSKQNVQIQNDEWSSLGSSSNRCWLQSKKNLSWWWEPSKPKQFFMVYAATVTVRWQGGLEEAEAMLAPSTCVQHVALFKLRSPWDHFFYCFFEIYFWHTSEISHLAVNAAVGVMGKHATRRRSICDSRKTCPRFLLSRKSCRSHCLGSISISFNHRVDLSYQVDFLLRARGHTIVIRLFDQSQWHVKKSIMTFRVMKLKCAIK